MFEAIKAQGYLGSYVRVCVHVRRLRQEISDAPHRKAFVPLTFGHGEAFQFDWSCEYAWIGGLRRRLEISHCKLACSRAFWLVAYPMQSHEMLFDAHTRSFQAFGGIPRRGIYDFVPRNKIGILWRSPLCVQGTDDPHEQRRSAC